MADMEGPCTLYVRNLPSQLPVEDREDLLRFYGAQSVRCMSDNSHMKYGAFAVFTSPDAAAHALLELHQLEVLGSRLNVTFSSKQFLHPAPVKVPRPRKQKEQEEPEAPLEPIIPDDIDSLSSAHKVDYPINPKLMYSYPPPTVEILTNIANAMASVPKFYVQVLHLMNKMNLPAPFGPMTANPPVPRGVGQNSRQTVRNMDMSSTEESELESDGEVRRPAPVAVKRPATTASKQPIIKRQKLQRIMSKPTTVDASKTTKVLKREDVFERPPVEERTKPKSSEPTKRLTAALTVDKDIRKFITLRELERNRLSSRRMRKLNLFQDYEPGDRNSILMVQNLHKDVPEAMITYIFGRYINWESDAERASYGVSLDRDDRSCTVSFPSDDVAELALQETNGYKMMGEYIVVKFAPKPAVIEVTEEPTDIAPEVREDNVPLEKPNRETIVAENLSVIEAAFSASTDAPIEDIFAGGKTPPGVDGGATPERMEVAASPEPATTTEIKDSAITEPTTESTQTAEDSLSPVVPVSTDDNHSPVVTTPDDDSTKKAPTPEPTPSVATQPDTEKADSVPTTSSQSRTPTQPSDVPAQSKTVVPQDLCDEELEEYEEAVYDPLADYEDSRYISPQELKKSRITEEKMVNFKVFKNYDPGEPSNRLYIKNLNHKDVKEFEFLWLFGRFLKDRGVDAADVLVIKLMKEGRMKGQAFVTFPSAREAETALRAVNGYVLHGKPMVVQFGKQS